jgi:putative DNA primase/helicase
LILLISSLVGGSFTAPNLRNWLEGKRFHSVMNKAVIGFPDIRLKPVRYFGASVDPGGLDATSAEMLLRIIAGDPVNVPEYYGADRQVKLATSVVMASNTVPNFNDAVLPDRFIKLLFEQSFLGKEDLTLLDKLLLELPGIAVKSIQAFQSALARGRLTQPSSGADLTAELEDTSNPLTRFVKEMLVYDPKSEAGISMTAVLPQLKAWCIREGQESILRGITEQNLIRHLRQVPGLRSLKKIRGPRPARLYRYPGLTWKRD